MLEQYVTAGKEEEASDRHFAGLHLNQRQFNLEPGGERLVEPFCAVRGRFAMWLERMSFYVEE